MIVYTPIDLPKIEPDNWEVFWDIWNTHRDYLVKTKMSTSLSLTPVGINDFWLGLDIVKKISISPTAWQAPFFDIKTVLPNMYNSLMAAVPNAVAIRLIQSQKNIFAHTDDNRNAWYMRAYLHYTSSQSQWYLTKPHDAGGNRTYIDLPEETNWFAYNDLNCWHGTDFDPHNKKILLQVFCNTVPSSLITRSINKYKNYTIDF
jgi:hypothetical protein